MEQIPVEEKSGNVSEDEWEDGGARKEDEESIFKTMDSHWRSDNRIVNRDSTDFRMLRGYNEMMKDWIKKNGGIENPNIWGRMENVTPDGGIKKRSFYPGQPGMLIKEGMHFMMTYTGYVEPDFQHPVDAVPYRGKREIFKYETESLLLQGIAIAIGTMCLGEGAHFRITPEYAYGHQGVPPRIPKDAVLHYIIEVRDEEISTFQASHKFLREPEDMKTRLGFDVCFAAAQQFREKGVTAFKKGNDERAIENFEDKNKVEGNDSAINQNCHVDYEELNQAVRVQAAALKRNATICYSRLSDWKKVKKLSKELYEIDNRDFRAIYYLASALVETGKSERAMELVKEGLRIRPSSPELSELYTKLSKRGEKDFEKEKLFCIRMFPGFAAKDETKKKEWTVSSEVREHVAQEIAKVKKDVHETPMKYSMFGDKINMAYLNAEAAKAGLVVEVKQGKARPIIRLCRPVAG